MATNRNRSARHPIALWRAADDSRTYTALAQDAHVERSALSNVVAGRRAIGRRMAFRIMLATGGAVPFGELVGWMTNAEHAELQLAIARS